MYCSYPTVNLGSACRDNQAWPKVRDSGSRRAGVRGFESSSLHHHTYPVFYYSISIKREMLLLRPSDLFLSATSFFRTSVDLLFSSKSPSPFLTASSYSPDSASRVSSRYDHDDSDQVRSGAVIMEGPDNVERVLEARAIVDAPAIERICCVI